MLVTTASSRPSKRRGFSAGVSYPVDQFDYSRKRQPGDDYDLDLSGDDYDLDLSPETSPVQAPVFKAFGPMSSEVVGQWKYYRGRQGERRRMPRANYYAARRAMRYGEPSDYQKKAQIALYGGVGGYGRRRKYRRRRRKFRRLPRKYRKVYYRGRGGFWQDLGKGLKWGWDHFKKPLLDMGQIGATMYNPTAGLAYGAARKASGIGAYGTQTTSNALVDGGSSTQFQAPLFAPQSDTGSVVISHREFIGKLYAPKSDEGNFHLQEYEVNPGLSSLFPWLSSIAQNYDSYELIQCIVSVKSLVSESIGGDGIIGSIYMAHQEDLHQGSFRTAHDIMQFQGSVSCKASSNLMLGLECDPSKVPGSSTHKFVRVEGIDRYHRQIQDFDMGKVSIATADLPTNLQGDAIGELWISYTVKLSTPKVVGALGKSIEQSVFVCADPALALVSATGSSNSHSKVWTTDPSKVYKATSNVLDVSVGYIDSDGTTQLPASTSADASLTSSNFEILGGNLSHDSNDAQKMGFVEIVLPSNLRGDFEIEYLAQTAATSAGFNTQFLNCVLVKNKLSGISALDDIVCLHNSGTVDTGSGNYTQISDISTLKMKTSCLYNATSHIRILGESDGAVGVIVKAHIHVEPATRGNVNVVMIGMALEDASAAVAEGVTLRVSRINSLFDSGDRQQLFESPNGLKLTIE